MTDGGSCERIKRDDGADDDNDEDEGDAGDDDDFATADADEDGDDDDFATAGTATADAAAAADADAKPYLNLDLMTTSPGMEDKLGSVVRFARADEVVEWLVPSEAREGFDVTAD